jgi:hypothetical protein
VFVPESVSVLDADVDFVTTPEPEMTPDSV